jgi:ABC-2 type transport system permease protein
MEIYRAGLFGGQFNAPAMVIGSIVTIGILILGVVIFPRLEPAVLKEI